MQFAGSLLSKEQMKTVKGGTDTYGGIYSGGNCTIYFDYNGGCENWPVSFSGSQSDVVNYADRMMGTSGVSGYRVSC